MSHASLFLILIFSNFCNAADSIDLQLKKLMDDAKVVPLAKPDPINSDRYELGKNLFFDKILSGEKNISCSTCHSMRFGTADARPFGVGAGGRGLGPDRQALDVTQNTTRHVPALFNLSGEPSHFWDGRVSFDFNTQIFSTPERGLNGNSPLLSDVTKVLKLARGHSEETTFASLAVQTLFPINNSYEMRSTSFSGLDANKYWQLLMTRFIGSPDGSEAGIPVYKEMFLKAYPEVTDAAAFNIGHVAVALAEFIRTEFATSETPFDRYVAGDLQGLTLQQKQGAVVFYSSKGKCAQCHSGPHLTDFQFKGIAVPQSGLGIASDGDDYGHYHVTFRQTDKFKFRTPPLRNVSLTAPYMHNGIFKTLTEVVDHYNDVLQGLRDFDYTRLSEIERLHMVENKSRDEARFNTIEPEFQLPLRLTDQEKKALVDFLENGLTDPKSKDLEKKFKDIQVPSGLSAEY